MQKPAPLHVEAVAAKLSGVVAADYQWPSQPAGWQLEFIAYPGGDIDMDFLHPVSATFWSEENDYLPVPVKVDGTPLKAFDLHAAGIPYMTPCGQVTVNTTASEPHLKLV